MYVAVTAAVDVNVALNLQIFYKLLSSFVLFCEVLNSMRFSFLEF